MDAVYRSELNRDVAPAAPGEFSALTLGPLRVWPPVVLAPMAGVTNYPFRRLCRRFGAGLYVSEMITAKALCLDNEKTWRLAAFGPDESPRSLQLYGIDPDSMAEATRRLVGDGHVDHIDMNFGCPVRKVTSKGGGSAIPVKPRLLARLVRAVVANAGDVPVTIKFRLGIDDGLLTYRDAGRVGEQEGCAAVGLHARTAEQLYDGEARWDSIAELKAHVSIPVLGNGDIWEAEDALRMMRTTGCDGVIVGRGCLGRPWLFAELAAVFDGRAPDNPPDFGSVMDIFLEHAALVCEWSGEERGIVQMRKWATWYTKSFYGGAALRSRFVRAKTLAELHELAAGIDRTLPFPAAGMRARRGKRSGTQRVVLPHGYLDDRMDDTPPCAEAEEAISGG
ncbi:MAG: tRNA dihydrouridine synthase DusB [Planctomycetota bacterium]